MSSSNSRSFLKPLLIAIAILFCVASVGAALAYPVNWAWVGPALGAVAWAAVRYVRGGAAYRDSR
jgi:hypothetical protein